jgi:phage shock protein A
MTDLIDKLNVLVRSSLQSVRPEGKPSKRRGKTPSLEHLGSDIDQEIAALRKQIDAALDDEDRMNADLKVMQSQAADWDQQADQALGRSDEASARYAIHQMQLQQQRATMLQADIEEHRRSTSELIQRVNELEALVAEARRQQQTAPPAPAPTQKPAAESLSDRMRKARLFIETQEMEALKNDAPPVDVDAAAVDDDLARRRARLSQ